MMMNSQPLKQRVAMYTLAFLALAGTATIAPLHADVQKHIVHLPLEIKSDGIPRIKMKVNDTNQEFVLDTGSREALHLTKEYMQQLPDLIILPEKRKSTDLTGKIFYNDIFSIERISINGMPFNNVKGVSYQQWGLTLSQEPAPQQDEMVIGLGLFKDRSILIDYKNQVLSVADKLPELAVDPSKGWALIPFKLTEEGLTIKVKQGSHEYNMIMDTGASGSMFFKEKLKAPGQHISCDSAGFTWRIENCEAGQFQLVDLPEYKALNTLIVAGEFNQVEFDGLIGRDFFDQYAVAIDFSEQRLFVKPH